MNKITKNHILLWNKNILPGKPAQNIMSPHPDRNHYTLPNTYKKAGVMILLFEHDNEWNFVLIQRTKHPKDKHSGQISLPGGQLDIQDHDLISCAKRETFEEIGIHVENILHIASLTPIYVPVSGFMVYPQVGLYEGDINNFTKQEDEVETIIFTSLNQLLDESTVESMDITTSYIKLSNVPYFNINNHVVWGATAMMLSEFKQWIK